MLHSWEEGRERERERKRGSERGTEREREKEREGRDSTDDSVSTHPGVMFPIDWGATLLQVYYSCIAVLQQQKRERERGGEQSVN